MSDHEMDYELGMIGLGVMGRNLLLNMADKGFSVAGYDIQQEKVDALKQDAQGKNNIEAFNNLKTFVGSLKSPKVVMLLIPAGAPVDEAIHDLLLHLTSDDLIIDGGNSHFIDTDRRARMLDEEGIHFLGVGISGGEAGARNGPSMMPGGPRSAYELVRKIFEAVSARAGDEPCVAYMGPGSAGHYVKMVHNSIEYGLMQLLAECYDLMKTGLNFNNDQIHERFHQWNQSTGLNSYLMEITATIFKEQDPDTGKCLIDEIQDAAKQKGTGIWASQDSMELQTPMPTIDTAVSMRDLSAFKDDRVKLSKQLAGPQESLSADVKQQLAGQLENALRAAIIITYAQGMSLLGAASQKRQYELNLQTVAKIWRGGCIIRSDLLESIAEAYGKQPALATLLLDASFAKQLSAYQADLRAVCLGALSIGVPVPALMASMNYYDAYRREWLPANLIQAQRDYFGAHTYERIGKAGSFHTEWGQQQSRQEEQKKEEQKKEQKMEQSHAR